MSPKMVASGGNYTMLQQLCDVTPFLSQPNDPGRWLRQMANRRQEPLSP